VVVVGRQLGADGGSVIGSASPVTVWALAGAFTTKIVVTPATLTKVLPGFKIKAHSGGRAGVKVIRAGRLTRVR